MHGFNLLNEVQRKRLEALLPAGVGYEDHQGDLVLFSKDMKPELYKQLMFEMPKEIRSRFIGWKSTRGTRNA